MNGRTSTVAEGLIPSSLEGSSVKLALGAGEALEVRREKATSGATGGREERRSNARAALEQIRLKDERCAAVPDATIEGPHPSSQHRALMEPTAKDKHVLAQIKGSKPSAEHEATHRSRSGSGSGKMSRARCGPGRRDKPRSRGVRRSADRRSRWEQHS